MEKKKKIFRGVVISDKMDKTIVVEHERLYKHHVTSKVIRSVKRYKVHDELEKAQIGDVVEFFEGRPMAKTKYMYLSRVIS